MLLERFRLKVISMNLKDPILITGCARSGTSLIAAIINEAGAKGGVINVGGNQYNPTGYYENHEIITNVDKSILSGQGFDPMGQRKLPDENFIAADVRKRIFNIASSQGITAADTWFFKDAKLLLLYRSYVKSFPGSKIVLVRRQKEAIVKSCKRTPFMNGRNTEAGWLEWVNHHIMLMACLKAVHSKVCELWYEDLLVGNLTPLRECITWLGLEYHKDYVNSIVIR